jgi:L-iditol 2-dehydrogenase
MKFESVWVQSPGKLVTVQKSVPEPGFSEVVVQVRACGICGTDLHFYRDMPAGVPTPLGHEVTGVVHAVGLGVCNVTVGMAVVVQNNVACGFCEACLNQRPDSCSNIGTYMDDQGGMGGFLVVPQSMVIPFEGLGFEEATLAEPVTVALDLCREAQIRLHDTVLIMGPGAIGLSCIPIVRMHGARRVVVVGHHLDSVRGRCRHDAAISLGADEVFDTALLGWKTAITKSYPQGFDRVIVTSPPSTIVDGIELAGFRGYIVFNGISFTNDMVAFHANDFHFAKKRLIASHAIPNWGFPQAMQLLKDKTIDPAVLLTHRYSLADLGKALELSESKEIPIIKAVVTVS